MLLPMTGPTEWPASWGPAPRWATRRRPERPSFGPVVARLAREIFKLDLFPWQRYVLDVALEVLGDGSWAYNEVRVLAPRRSGKTAMVTGLVSHRCGQPAPALSFFTAQSGDAALARWGEISGRIVRSAMGDRVKKKISIGHEQLAWPGSGSLFKPFTPKENAIHGAEPDLVFVDELWWFSMADKMALEDAWVPVFSVKPGQAWLLSAAGTSRSEWLKDARETGRAAIVRDSGEGVAHFEWGLPEEVGGVKTPLLSDGELLDLTLAAHPRRDHGIRRGFLESELAQSRSRFLRAYGNLDADETASETVIDERSWNDAKVRERIPETALVGLGIGVDQDGVDSSVSAAWRRPDGVALTELIAHRPGTRWVGPAVQQIVAAHHPVAVAINNVGHGRDVADELATAGVELLRLGMSDWGAACTRFKSGIEEQPFSVSHDGHPEVENAMRHAGLRETKTGLTMWAKTSEVTVTVLESHTAAVWAVDHPGEVEPVKTPFRIW